MFPKDAGDPCLSDVHFIPMIIVFVSLPGKNARESFIETSKKIVKYLKRIVLNTYATPDMFRVFTSIVS